MRFATIGMTSTAITVTVFNLLTHVGSAPVMRDHPIEAYALGMVAGTSVSFVGNRWWVFGAGGSPAWTRQLVVFVGLNVIGTIIPSACLAISRYGLGLDSALSDNIAANVVGLLLATLFRFWAYKHVAFAPATTA